MDNFVIDSIPSTAGIKIANYLYDNLLNLYRKRRPIIFLCIGTDRSTGDSVGPLTGYKLRNIKSNNIYVYGSLENPIHSKNLINILDKIHYSFNDPYIIAIDSCLGSSNNVGKIFINNTPLKPGLALNKQLPEVGDISIVGNVNISGNFDFITLQNTRLYTVMNIVDSISTGIYIFIKKCNNYSHNLFKDSYI